MAEAGPPRVVLLAAPGEARARLQAAVRDAGAEVVLVEDAAQVDAGAVLQLAPQAVVMVVDGGSEPALARLEPLLAESGISVLFEDADLIAAREGWDAARWLRHLSAKLHRHQDVLPPVPEGAVRSAAPRDGEGLDTTGLRLAAIEGEASNQGVAVDDPVSPFDPAQWEAAPSGDVTEFADAAGIALELDDADNVAAEPPALERDDGGTAVPGAIASPAARAAMDLALADNAAIPASAAREAAVAAPGSGGGMFSNLSLVDDEATPADATGARTAPEPPSANSANGRGAVVVFGGMGAPDAMRQLLGHLPSQFARPLLVRMQLQGGRYDRLVKQMGKATKLPVSLAISGDPVRPGHVYFMAPGLTVGASGDGESTFVEGDERWPAALDESESALILLSGSDADCAAVAERLRASALCLGQSPESAYDAAACARWAASGGEVADPEGLALRLARRWPSLDSLE